MYVYIYIYENHLFLIYLLFYYVCEIYFLCRHLKLVIYIILIYISEFITFKWRCK